MTVNQVAEASVEYQVVGEGVPVGYKMTEVGLIPEDWECKLLGELGDVVRGGSPRPAGDPKYFNGHFIPWLTVASLTNIPAAQQVVETTSSMLTELGSKQSRVLEKGTLIISNSGATLGVAKILGLKCCANDGVAAIINQKSGNKSFLTHYINTQTKVLHDKVATGNGQPNLNTDLIKLIAVPFPKEKEQTAIANALSDVDALINGLEKLITKKQAIKTATMQQLLTGRTRLPQFALREDGTPKGYKPSELGEVPEDWGIVTLSELASIRSGGTPSTTAQEYWDGLINWCTPTDITALKGKKYLSSTARKITELGVVKSAAELLPVGTIVMTSRATIGECAIAVSEVTTNQGFKSFICNQNTNNEFLYYLLGTLKDRFIGLCSGSTFLEISTSQVRNFQVCVPKKDEQASIATILSDMDEEIQTLQQRLSKTRQIKQGMMQELLTGKTRLIKPAQGAA